MTKKNKIKDNDPNSADLSDPTDITSIYNKYHNELRGYISKRVSFKEDVEDILQNVFYNLSKADLIENPVEQISSWLYSVTKNQIIDRSRKKKEERIPVFKKNNIDDDFMGDISELLADDTNDPEMKYLQSVIWNEFSIALEELPEEQKTVYELTELQGFSFKEISESTGIPVNTLISRKRYAVLYLRERLRELYGEVIND
jgi:RNA polymerase sigma factor (sigma-70 family)